LNTRATSVARRASRELVDRAQPERNDSPVQVSALSEWLQPHAPELHLTAADSPQFLFVHSGGGSIELDGAAFVLRPGSTVAVPSSTVCILRLQPNSEGICLKARESYFRSEVVTTLPTLIEAGERFWKAYYTPTVFHDFAGDANRARRDDVLRELVMVKRRLGMGCDPAVTAYLIVVMFEPHLITARQMPVNAFNNAETSARGLVLEFRNLVEQNFLRHLQVHDYCELLNVTPRRLSQACGLAMGVTPLSIIHDRVILEARRELVYSKKSVATVAAGLGFEDVGYFSRFVKQHTGKSPIGFRR
jgi:AraC family transcriptional regulator, transcriptional activator of pobA